MRLRIQDLIDVPAFQNLLDELHTAGGIPSALITVEGEVLAGAGWQRICTEFHRRHPEALRLCVESDTRWRESSKLGEPYILYRCPHGLIDGCAPVIIGGEHVANVFSGQVLLEPPESATVELFRRQAGRYGFEEGAYLDALRSVPVFPEPRFRAALGVLSKLAGLLSASGLDRLREREGAERLRESEARYRKLFEEATVGIALADPETGAVLDCNRAFEQLSGYDRSELLGASPPPPASKEEGPSAAVRAFKGPSPGEGVHRAELVTKSGAIRQVEIKADVLELGGRKVAQSFYRDVTAEQRYRRERETTLELLRLLNDQQDTGGLIRGLTGFFQEWTGCEAVGVRLREGDDFPYFETRGFPPDFVQAENHLCVRGNEGGAAGDRPGAPALECMCGNVLCGRTNVALPFFTAKGSFWTNSTTELLAGTTEAQRQTRTRNRCNGEGYESVALVALRHGGRTLGLLQFNDRARDRFTPELVTFLENAADQVAMALAERGTQAALRESEERFRRAMDATNDGLWDWDVAGGRVYYSPAYLRMLGYEPGELPPGRGTWLELIHPEDRDQVLAANEACVRNDSPAVRVEFRMRCRDGTWRWILGRGRAVSRDSAGRALHMVGTHVDITERKRAEEVLSEGEERYRSLFENMLEGFAHCKMLYRDGKPQDFIYLAVNRNFEKLTGLKDVVGKTVTEVIPGIRESDAELLAIYGRVASTGVAEKFERYVEALKMWFSISVYSPKREHFVAVFDVITDRKLTEAALRESESSLKRSQEIAHVGHWTWDTRANTVKWSEEMHRIFGMDPQAFDGDLDEVVRRAIHPDDVTRVREMNDQASREGRAGETEYRVVWPDGSIRHVWAVPADRVTDEHGRILRLSGVVQDITERKRAEEEREKLEVQLAQAQKLESVGRLAGGVAHDFNNMLAVVIGRAELAKMRLGAEDPLRSDLEEILTAAGRSADLTRQLLAFARRQTVRPEVLDPNDAVAGMLQMLRRLIGEDIDLAWMPGHDVWPIRIDPSQLDQILANLAVNARDALSGAGSVILGTENVVVDDPKWPGQEDFVPGDYVLLTVADTGAGMDREVLEHIFEPFFTTKEVGKGTGLGLATVHGVVRQNHGFIGVCSEPGKGTTFRIYLPRCQAEAAGASVQAASSPLGGTETLLLVEDDEAILGVLTILLERAGYTVLAAQAPSQALRLAEGHSGEIHLLLTDVVMPEMNGRQLADRLRGLRPGMKCLYMSGYTTDAIAHRGVLDEGVQFLSKPIRRNDLLAALRRVLDGK